MLSSTISYINSHKLTFILIIVILVIIAIVLYYSCNECNSYTENFGATSAPATLINNINVTNPLFPISEENIKLPNYPSLLNGSEIDFIKKESIVRLRTTINGNNYYLMVVPISKCGIITQTDKTVGCLTNTIVLVDEKTVLQNVSEYLEDLRDKEKICNYQHHLQSKRGSLKIAQSLNNASPLITNTKQNMSTQETMMPNQESENDENEQNCKFGQYTSCKFKQQYPIDFHIEKHVTSLGKNKYAIRGINGNLNIDMGTSQYYLNLNTRAEIKNDTVVGTLCADSTTVDKTKSNILMDLMMTEIPTQTMETGIKTPRYRAKIRISLEVKPLQFDNNGKPIRRHFFLGVCKNNICSISDTKYARACLFTDLLDQNVLEFEPIVIDYE